MEEQNQVTRVLAHCENCGECEVLVGPEGNRGVCFPGHHIMRLPKPTPPAIMVTTPYEPSVQDPVLRDILNWMQRPWYQNFTALIPGLVAILALLLTSVTAAEGYYRTKQQDTHDNRAELRSLLQRLNDLPRENAEVFREYPLPIAANLSGNINAENVLLATEAAAVIEDLPSEYISAEEYIVVATAFRSAGIFDETRKYLDAALDASKNLNEELAAIRSYAALEFESGNIKEGKVKYREALNIFEEYPPEVPSYVSWTHAQTEMNWARAELEQRQYSEAEVHIKKAFVHARTRPPGFARDSLLQQIKALQIEIEMNWARAELEQRQYSEAEVHIKKAFDITYTLPSGFARDSLVQQITTLRTEINKNATPLTTPLTPVNP